MPKVKNKKPVSSGKKKEKEDLLPIEEWAKRHKLPAWEAASLMAAAGWAKGKQVSEKQFSEALMKFRNRPQGGGRI